MCTRLEILPIMGASSRSDSGGEFPCIQAKSYFLRSWTLCPYEPFGGAWSVIKATSRSKLLHVSINIYAWHSLKSLIGKAFGTSNHAFVHRTRNFITWAYAERFLDQPSQMPTNRVSMIAIMEPPIFAVMEPVKRV